ncbi:MAG: hypothetical protein RIQ59_689 [Bacteroidota bacterium]|jgi:hypothetical protein
MDKFFAEDVILKRVIINFIIIMEKEKYIKVLFKHDAFDIESFEGAWVKIVNEEYILDNILFYAKEYSLGDVISINKEHGEIFATGLIKESGHSTLRLLFNDADKIENVRKDLENRGCTSEISNIDTLISVDIPPNVSYKALLEYLKLGEEYKEWEYEEACISSYHQY